MLEIKLNDVLKHTTINIELNDGAPKIYAIQGFSGIGKTTILNIIAGLKKAKKAYIKVNDCVLTDTRNKININIQQRHIGYLFQDYQLFPHMSVYQNITFMACTSAHINHLTQTLKIDHLLTRYPATLSGGEAQRVALARSLSMKPNLILLDEPFASLDDETKEESIALVKEVFAEWHIPIIFVTHSNYEAQQLAHETIILNNNENIMAAKRSD